MWEAVEGLLGPFSGKVSFERVLIKSSLLMPEELQPCFTCLSLGLLDRSLSLLLVVNSVLCKLIKCFYDN